MEDRAENKGESLTDLAMEIQRLMAVAFPGPTDRTREIVARDVFLDVLDDPELTFEIHTQRPRDLDSTVQIAQYLKAVMRSLPSRSSKPVRTVVQGGDEGKLPAELRDLCAGQRHFHDTLKQFGKMFKDRPNKQQVSDTRPRAALPINLAERRAPDGDENAGSAQYGVFRVRKRGELRLKLRSGYVETPGTSDVRDRNAVPGCGFGFGAEDQ